MKNTIKEILKQTLYLLNQINKIIYYFRIQNYDFALRWTMENINLLSIFIDKLITNADYFKENELIINSKSFNRMIADLLEAQKNKDYILLADLYEAQLIPFFLKLQEIIINKEVYVFDEDEYDVAIKALNQNYAVLADSIKSLPHPTNLLQQGYEIEYTSVGLMTLAATENGKKYYFHSNNQVMQEAFTLANSWYSIDKSEYIIYGLGLGYHVNELYNLDNTISIEVYESDLNIIQLACAFSNISDYLVLPNIKLVYDPEFIQLTQKLNNIGNDTEFVIHYPSLRNIKNHEIRDKLENYFIQYSSVKNQLHLLNGNFRENIKHFYSSVDTLQEVFKNKDLFIIAAGPSLDKNFMQLKDVGRNGIILATGTVFRKLIKAGITPDYVIVSDANPRIYAQISGLENRNVPMLYLSTAFKGFAMYYQGEKYIICQFDYPKAEEFAKERGYGLYKTGGSVSTTALDIGIRLGCKRIVFLGLDLAYTDNYVHAAGTSKRELASTADLKQVEDIYGNMIYTSKSLDIYRRWIENRIKDEKGIEFIDATEGGAKKKGMKLIKLQDILSE